MLLGYLALAAAAAVRADGTAPGTVELRQYGMPVIAADGVFELDRAPFGLRVTHSGAASLHASTHPEAAGHAAALAGAPLVVPLDAVTVARPLVLHAGSDAIEWYQGLSKDFLARWGSAMGRPQLEAYALLSARLGREPRMVVNPRQSVLGAAGAGRFMVFAVNGVPVRSAPLQELVLVVFLDRSAGGGGGLWGVVEKLQVLRLRFRGPPEPELPLPGSSAFPHELDCGRTAAVAAVRNHDGRRVERLVAQGLDPALRVGPAAAPLLACATGGAQAHGAVVNALLDAGADPGARTADGATALHWAIRAAPRGTFVPARLDVVDLLIAAGADVDAVDGAGETPLLEAVSANQPEMAARLLAAGADALLPDGRGETPAARAQRLGLSDLADLLLLHAP